MTDTTAPAPGATAAAAASLALRPQHAMHDALTDALADQLRRLVEATRDDLRVFAAHIAADLAALPLIADAQEREAALQRTLDRARALAETQRVRAERAGWEAVSLVITTAARTLLAVAATA